jgi:peptidoglycan/xylan/chitin deacetylase (PgdA/CDA1 family)
VTPIAHQVAEGSAWCAAVAVAGAVTYAALGAQSQVFGKTLVAGNDPKQIALTYDDGPNEAATLALLDLLAKHGVRATFFMIGRHVRRHRKLAQAVHAAGHLIGNHTETHPWLTLMSPDRTRHELQDCNTALEDAIGAPAHYVRFPHGARLPYTIRIARELDLTPVQWNIMAHDWEPIGVSGILERVDTGLERARSRGVGANICMHDGHQDSGRIDRSDTLVATEQLLERLSATHQFVTVDAWG